MKIDSVMFSSGLFHGIPEDELAPLLACLECRRIDFSRGDIIAYSGQLQKYIGLVLEGSVSLAKENLQAQRMLISVQGPGDSFGEMNAYSGSSVWPVTVMAESKGSLLVIPLDRINSSCDKRCFGHWSLIVNLLKLVSKKALTLSRAIDYIGIKGIRRKLAIMILQEAGKAGSLSFKSEMNRGQMADYFFVTRPALSHELCLLRDDGAIEFQGRDFRILNHSLLKRIAEKDV